MRPLWWWVLTVLAYAVALLPSWWVVLLVIGPGVALTVTTTRLRKRGRRLRQRTAGAWEITERLAGALEDRIRGHHSPPAGQVYQYWPPGTPPEPYQTPQNHNYR